MYWPLASPTRCQWIGIARQRHVLAHAVQLDARDEHPARRHRHDVAAEVRLLRVGRSLDLDVASHQRHFAALIHVEGDLAEVHVVELLVERERVAADGGDGATLGLTRIEVRRREHDLVADLPAPGIQHLDGGGAGVGRRGELGPGVGGGTVQVQRAARQHDAAVAHAGHHVFALHVVGERDGGLAGVGLGFAADGELTVQHDPLGGQLEVGVVGEGELAVDGQTAQCWRADIQHHFLVLADGDLLPGSRNLAVGPAGRIRPFRGVSRLGSRKQAAQQHGWNQ